MCPRLKRHLPYFAIYFFSIGLSNGRSVIVLMALQRVQGQTLNTRTILGVEIIQTLWLHFGSFQNSQLIKSSAIDAGEEKKVYTITSAALL